MGRRRLLLFDVTVLLLKALLVPCLVAAASVAGHRFGQRASGLVAALPIVGGPVLLFYAWDHGAEFVARAAEQTLSGIFSLSAFCIAYAWLAALQRARSVRGAAFALLVSWGVFLACTAVLAQVALTGLVPMLLAAFGLILAGRCLPDTTATKVRSQGRDAPGRGAPSTLPLTKRLRMVELGLRMAATAALVLTLTSVAGMLGPALSGLLTPFPIASTVLLVCAHSSGGPAAVVLMLRGFLAGMWGFVWFCVAIAFTAVPLGPAMAFGLGMLGVALVQCRVLFQRRHALFP